MSGESHRIEVNPEKSRHFFQRAYRSDFSLPLRIFRNRVSGPEEGGGEKGDMVAEVRSIEEKHIRRRHVSLSFRRKRPLFL
jgi:hypothetical protein